MERIYIANKSHWPKELLQKALDEFKHDINSNNGRFYLLKVDEKIVSFSWFTDISGDTTYCGYFNVLSEARNANIGQALKQFTYEQEGNHKALVCYVYEGDEALVDNYRINYGFEIEQAGADPTGTGKKFYKLYRPALHKMAA